MNDQPGARSCAAQRESYAFISISTTSNRSRTGSRMRRIRYSRAVAGTSSTSAPASSLFVGTTYSPSTAVEVTGGEPQHELLRLLA